MKSMMRLGVHVSIAGRLSHSVERAEMLGCTAMQIFSRSPRGWAVPELDPGETRRFRELREKADIRPLAVHASYLINLASPDVTLHRRSILALMEELERADRLSADYLVVHVGCDSLHSEASALRRVAQALRRVLKGWHFKARLLLENTAGERGDIGHAFDQLGGLLKQLGDPDPIGVCLDTCHLFAAGYDIRGQSGVDLVAKEAGQTIGTERLYLIHANDSKGELGCRVDRHQHIGLGGIGLEGFRAWVNHPAFRDVPMILETPKDSDSADRINLKTIRGLREK
jgi:deoxyribonuclease-4